MDIVEEVRLEKPLIHCITNYVSANDCANVILSIGASPIMADCGLDIVDVTPKCNALLLNMGTLNEERAKVAILAGKLANQRGTPVVLDPVGVGATVFRQQAMKSILEEVQISVIKGNCAEIKTLAGFGASGKGVDSLQADDLNTQIEYAKMLSANTKSIVVSTGECDIVTDTKQTILVRNGHENMAGLTGAGCMMGAVIATYCSTGCDINSVVKAVTSVGYAGELAHEKMKQSKMGMGFYHICFMDEIGMMTEEKRKVGEKIEIR